MNYFIDIFEAINTLFWQDPVAQIIGFIALVVGASAFLHKDDQKLRYSLTVFIFFMAVHFSMLGLWTATIIALLGSARYYVSSLTKNFWVMLIFLFAAWLMAIPNSSEWFHLLPVIGVSFGTWAVFREKGSRMRFLMLLGTICWLSHNHLVGSIGGVVIEGVFLVINARTMFKLSKGQQTLR